MLDASASASDLDVRAPARPSSDPLFLTVWHPRCSASRAVQASLQRLAQQVEHVTFKSLNITEGPALAEKLGVESVPTLVVFRQGTIAARLHGTERIQQFADRLEEAMKH